MNKTHNIKRFMINKIQKYYSSLFDWGLLVIRIAIFTESTYKKNANQIISLIHWESQWLGKPRKIGENILLSVVHWPMQFIQVWIYCWCSVHCCVIDLIMLLFGCDGQKIKAKMIWSKIFTITKMAIAKNHGFNF